MIVGLVYIQAGSLVKNVLFLKNILDIISYINKGPFLSKHLSHDL